MLLRDLKGAIARRKVKRMARSFASFVTQQVCPSELVRRGLQACPHIYILGLRCHFSPGTYMLSHINNTYMGRLDYEQACKPEVS